MIVLLIFSTLGCNVKQSIFNSVDVATELPLNGSKIALTGNSTLCSSAISTQQLANSKIEKAKTLDASLLLTNDTTNLVYIPSNTGFRQDYVLRLAGTSPPLYLIHNQLKIALT